ncbi:MAG: restriction endonuclease subunit S [Opitutaceae bacterium]|nr:restriction endonuclease subunit S [Opitutaceae bacterium]MBP9900257.1 restriction endonuclease subunit S [Verrucomicrobiota bacterium]
MSTKFKKLRLAQLVAHDRPIVYGIVQAGEHLPNGVPYIRSTDVGGRIEPNNLLKTSPGIAARFGRSRVSPGDIVFSLRGNIGETSIVPDSLDGANLTQGTARISINGEYSAAFVRYALSHTEVHRHILSVAKGSTFHEITLEDLRNVELPLPPLPEQQRIADILGTWDEAQEKLDALIAAKARRKQALMQQLLAVAAQKIGHGHARHRLGEVVERVTRRNTVANDNVLTISAQDGLINQREYFNRNVAGADLSGYFLLRRGEFAYNRSSSIGFPYGAIKRLDRYGAGVVSTLYLCFRIQDTAKVSSDYLAHYLDGGFLNAGLRSVAKEGARAHGLLNITADEFMDIDIFLPPLALQTKIAAVLDTADAELRLLRQQRTALDHQKRGLMQQLLTGKVRVS